MAFAPVALVLLSTAVVCLSENVLLSMVLHRHGARSPFTFLPTGVDPNDASWTDGTNFITPGGAIIMLYLKNSHL